jgi:hypothetical protein
LNALLQNHVIAKQIVQRHIREEGCWCKKEQE